MRFFGERTQKARAEHFCDWCGEYIQPGEIYERRLWVTETGHIHVIKEHRMPACDLPFFEEEEEPVRMTLKTVLETRVVESLVLQVNGSVAVRSETILVARTVCVSESPDDDQADAIENDDDDEEVPF